MLFHNAVRKLGFRFSLRHTLYLLGALGGIAVLGWVLGIQMLMGPQQPQALQAASFTPDQSSQSGQALEVHSPGATQTPLQLATTSSKAPKTIVGGTPPPTFYPSRQGRQRSTIQESESASLTDDTSRFDAARSAWPSTHTPGRLPLAPSHGARALLVDLLRIPSEFNTEINQTLADLVRYGDEAVAAIQALLDAVDDDSDTGLSGLYGVELRPARLRLIHALDLIGSRMAVDTLVHTLRSTTQPTEIALLAKSVEGHAPGAYREDILTAAQATLGLTAANLKEVSRMLGNIQPLLTVYAAYGDAATVPDLEAAWSRLPSFSTVALGGLPDGVGIDSLIQFVNDPKVPERRKNFPVQILAQASRIYPDVGETLVVMADAKQLTGPAWAALAMALGGTETVLRTSLPIQSAISRKSEQHAMGVEGESAARMGSAVQVLYQQSTPRSSSDTSLAYLHYNSKAPATWSDAEIEQQLGLIDKLLATEPGSDAVVALEKARQSLSAWQQRELLDGQRKPL